MALGVIDFYSPVAKGFAAGFFCGDFGGESRSHRIKRNGVVLLRNDPAIFNRTGEFSVKPILEIFESGGFCLLLCFILGYEGPAQYHFLK
jgi:hypothetical protein